MASKKTTVSDLQSDKFLDFKIHDAHWLKSTGGNYRFKPTAGYVQYKNGKFLAVEVSGETRDGFRHTRRWTRFSKEVLPVWLADVVVQGEE